MTEQKELAKQKFEAKMQNKKLESIDNNLRNMFSKMKTGKRILLKDGRTGYFEGFSGNFLSGDTFEMSLDTGIEDVSIRDFASVLIENENVKCSSCNSYHIMDGFLSGSYQDEDFSIDHMPIIFKEKTTMKSQSVNCHACYKCGYIMLFIQQLG